MQPDRLGAIRTGTAHALLHEQPRDTVATREGIDGQESQLGMSAARGGAGVCVGSGRKEHHTAHDRAITLDDDAMRASLRDERSVDGGKQCCPRRRLHGRRILAVRAHRHRANRRTIGDACVAYVKVHSQT